MAAGGGDRQSLEGLASRLEREPSQADLYVEGPFDEALFRFVFRKLGLRNVSVKPIEWLHVPSSLFPPEIDPGNRDRVFRAARWIEEEMDQVPPNILFVFDLDADLLLGGQPHQQTLVAVDGACAEMYFWHPETVERALNLYAGLDVDPHACLDAIRAPLEELFLIRSATQATSANCAWIRFSSLLSLTDEGNVVLDSAEFLSRLVNGSGCAHLRDEIEGAVSELRQKLPPGVPPAANGHDFVQMLASYCHLKCNRSLRDLDRALLGGVVVEYLLEQPAMAEIVGRLSPFG